MVNPSLISGRKSHKTVYLSFRLPYFTQWGQSILVSGSEPVLGSWNVKKGMILSPLHQGGELIWYGRIAVPIGFGCEYSYYLVDDDRNVLRWEAGKKRKVVLPEGIQEGEVVELHDLWQTGSDALFVRSAFKNVIFSSGWNLVLEKAPGTLNIIDQQDSVVVQFKISCPRIDEKTLVYVVGDCIRLGRWKAQDGLNLSYMGESFWQADCVIQKEEFPIKYPFADFFSFV